MFRLLRLLLLMMCALPVGAADDLQDPAQARAEIARARKDIQRLEQQFRTLQETRSEAQRQLKVTELEIGQLEQQVRQLREDIGHNQAELQSLETEQAALEESKRDQQALIASQARAAYAAGRESYIKVLLSQKQPELVSRMLTYYEYLSTARQARVDTFSRTLERLAQVEAGLQQNQAQLQARQDELAAHRTRLETVRSDRQQALAALKQESQTASRQLARRRSERKALEGALAALEAELARQKAAAEARRQQQARLEAERKAAAEVRDSAARSRQVSAASAGVAAEGPFAGLRGELPWPVTGTVMARFGAPRDGDGRSRWDGILIGADSGSTVHAIHAGRVVFADWLRGAGLLVIVDHGNGYLSLYGYNQSLLRQAGDRVKAGDAIATVGNSGGRSQTALYFAIRQQGRPSDPEQWCRAEG